MRKECPSHGVFRNRIAKDAKRFSDDSFSAPAKPFSPSCAYHGDCGKDCGWCANHQQHICTGLIEITDDCNLACPVCYFGAKAPLLISYGARPDFQWLDFLLTGKSFLGGVVGAFIAINVYKAATRQMASSFGGRFAIPVAVAAGFGKIGCWFNGCCGGDFAVPPQLVESAFQFCAAVALYAAYRKTQRLDLLFPFYLVSYLVMRFMVEFVRTEPRLAFGLTLYQWIALAVIPAGLGIIIIRAKQVAVQSQKGGE